MNNYPLVSVIMPVFGVEKYIDNSIQSVLSQTYRNFELIIVDDGCKDSSITIAEKHRSTDRRVSIVQKQNGGLSDARNFGMNFATGTYVIYIDSDDYWEKNLLESLVFFAEKENLDITVFGYYADSYDSHDKKVGTTVNSLSDAIIRKPILQPTNIENIQVLGYAWNKLYRASLLKEHAIAFTVGLSFIEDVLFNAAAFAAAKSFGFRSGCYYHYIQRHRETLGTKYYPHSANLDKISNDAFSDILATLGVAKNLSEKIIRQNIINKSAWSSRIIAREPTIDIKTKKKELSEIAGNTQGIPWNIAENLWAKILLFMLQNEQYTIVLFLESVKAKRIKRFIIESLPLSLKRTIQYYISRSNSYQDVLKSDKKILLMLAADYGNLGDVAITYAQKQFLQTNFPGRKIVQVPVSQTYSELRNLRKKINNGDIVTLIGGGNMGDLYSDIESARRLVIKKFKKNMIIAFPQTIDFSNSLSGVKSLHKSQSVYDAHHKLLLTARESRSFEIMKKTFATSVILTPDIVLSLDLHRSKNRRDKNKVIFCIRDDNESSLSRDDHNKLKAYFSKRGIEIEYYDTHTGDTSLTESEASLQLARIWNAFSQASFVVTDRLHGMIFCAITRTPCISINNANGKVAGVYDLWVEQLGGTTMLNGFHDKDIKKCVDWVMGRDIQSTRKLKAKFAPLVSAIRKAQDV